MEIHRLLHWPVTTDDGTWVVIGETKSEIEMQEFRRSLKRNAIINTHIVNCTMDHERMGIKYDLAEHKMKVQWTRCTSVLCHPKDTSDSVADQTKRNACRAQLRMSTCQYTYHGIVCQAYNHLSDEHDSAEPMQSYVTDDMKSHIISILRQNPDTKPMTIYKDMVELHNHGKFGNDPMPTKTQLRNALTYLKNRKLKIAKSCRIWPTPRYPLKCKVHS